MDILATFEDGSSAYLEHFGVKGMKWGVWNAETRARRAGAKQHQKNLRKIDRDLKNYTVAEQQLHMSNDRAKAEYVRGKLSKKELNDYMTKNTGKKLEAVSAKKKELAKNLVDELTATKNEGYHVTIRPTNFSQLTYPRGKEFKTTAKQLTEKYGKSKWTLTNYSPASSGNYFKVREPDKMSAKQKERLSRESNLSSGQQVNTYRPQRIYYS